MVKVWPPIVRVPRRASPLLRATLNDTVPFPVPFAPLVIVIQVESLVAVQAHVLADAVTVTDPVPPLAPKSCPDLSSENEHGGGGGGGGGAGAAACETVNVRPAATIEPDRAAPVFAATENDTEPLPVPELPAVIVIQPALDPAVHAHVAADAVTANEPVPPESPTA